MNKPKMILFDYGQTLSDAHKKKLWKLKDYRQYKPENGGFRQ